MAFNAIAGDVISARTKIKMAASSTIAVGDAIDFTSGYARRATSSTTEVKYVALEAKTTGSGENPFIRVMRTDRVIFEADTANNTAQSLVGTKVDLTDHDTVNDAATTTKVFYVENVVGAAATKKIIGNFVMKVA